MGFNRLPICPKCKIDAEINPMTQEQWIKLIIHHRQWYHQPDEIWPDNWKLNQPVVATLVDASV